LLRGRNPQRLSEHYRLDCDYGTQVMSIYKTGECNDPLYLCGAHYAEGGYAASSSAEVRAVPAAPRLAPAAAIAPVESSAPAAPIAVASVAQNPALTPASFVYRPAAVQPFPVVVPASDVTAPVLYDAPRASVTPASIGATAASVVASPKPTIAPAPNPPAQPKPAVPRVVRPAGTRTNAPRDITYGDSAKALVDEAIWNLPTGDLEAYASALKAGKSPLEAAQAAGGQMAFIHRKIGDYTFKMEMVLSESGAKISSAEVIEKPFEQATLQIIERDMPDAEKDEAITRLGSLQQAINGGVGKEMTPLQAHRIGLAIGDRAGWGSVQLPEELKPIYRAVYVGLREAVRAAVPLAHNFDDRIANLYAAKAELESSPAPGQQRLTA
jgi:hypothetical protein